MRLSILFLVFLACSIAKAQEKPQALQVEVIPIKFADCAGIVQVLSGLDLQVRMTPDARTNCIFVQANDENLKKIKEYIGAIDKPNEDERTLLLKTNLQKKNTRDLEFVQQLTSTTGVEIAVDKETGVVLVKGQSDKVERTVSLLERMMEIHSKKQEESKAIERSQFLESYAIRFFWLSNEPTEDPRNPIEIDTALRNSIQKLGAHGFPNMRLKMQLLGRCDNSDGRSQARVEGTMVTGNTRRTMNARANLILQSEKEVRGQFNLEVQVADLKASSTEPSSAERATVEVSVNLEPDKYYILSASPVNGYQTALVVQLVTGL